MNTGGGGNGVHDATADPAEVKDWWRRFPGANAVIAVGAPSGFRTLAVDPVKDGGVSPGALEAAYGPMPITPERPTGSGRPLLPRDDTAPICNRAGRLGPGLDARALAGNAGDGVIALAAGMRRIVKAELRRTSGRGDGGRCS